MVSLSHHGCGACGWLASVRDKAEADMVAGMGVDIIDMKEPSLGVLGVPSMDTCRSIWEAWGQHKTLSVAGGDYTLPSSESSVSLLYALARTGVDVVKMGLRLDDTAWDSVAYGRCFARWQEAVGDHAQWACVLFADDKGFKALWRRLVSCAFSYGCYALVVDTASKTGLSLPHYLSYDEMCEITDYVRGTTREGRGAYLGQGISILAGSLRFPDIVPCRECSPDYLGFRGLLCEGVRSGSLSAERLKCVARYFGASTVSDDGQ